MKSLLEGSVVANFTTQHIAGFKQAWLKKRFQDNQNNHATCMKLILFNIATKVALVVGHVNVLTRNATRLQLSYIASCLSRTHTQTSHNAEDGHDICGNHREKEREQVIGSDI